MITVSVTAEDIAAGEAGNCFRCAVALALQRATGDSEANVYESDFALYAHVWSRHISVPFEVRHFVRDFDGQPRKKDGTVDAAHPEYEPMEPFAFELPDQTGPEWQERCCVCEEWFDGTELDDEGCCPECADEDAGEGPCEVPG